MCSTDHPTTHLSSVSTIKSEETVPDLHPPLCTRGPFLLPHNKLAFFLPPKAHFSIRYAEYVFFLQILAVLFHFSS